MHSQPVALDAASSNGDFGTNCGGGSPEVSRDSHGTSAQRSHIGKLRGIPRDPIVSQVRLRGICGSLHNLTGITPDLTDIQRDPMESHWVTREGAGEVVGCDRVVLSHPMIHPRKKPAYSQESSYRILHLSHRDELGSCLPK